VIYEIAYIKENTFGRICETYHEVGGDKMYPNLKAEIARNNLTLEKMVNALAEIGHTMTISTLSLKLNGKYPITLNEAKALKQIVGTDIPLDTLFEEAI